jgi:hypothetical protein
MSADNIPSIIHVFRQRCSFAVHLKIITMFFENYIKYNNFFVPTKIVQVPTLKDAGF